MPTDPLADRIRDSEQISKLEKEMRAAAKRLEFEEAAVLRDRVQELKELQIFSA